MIKVDIFICTMRFIPQILFVDAMVYYLCDCDFQARHLQAAGAIGGIVIGKLCTLHSYFLHTSPIIPSYIRLTQTFKFNPHLLCKVVSD